MKKKNKDLFPIILLGGIATGAVIGIVFKEKATILKPLGDIFLNLMFTIVAPMVLVSISTAVGNMVDMSRLGKILKSTISVFLITGLIAALISILIFTFLPPADSQTIEFEESAISENTETNSAGEMIVGALTVNDFPKILSKDNMLPIIVFSILFGLAVSANGGQESAVGKFLNNLNEVIMTLISYIMKFAPIGLGAYFANLVGEFGPDLIKDYGRALIIYYPLVFVYMLIMFPIYAYYSGGKDGINKVKNNIFEPAITAFATQSSVAALPVNKKACDTIGVPGDISDIVLPLGATMHMDGSVISSILKISFLYAIFDMQFAGAHTYIMSIIASIMSAFVLSGAPGGGLVGEMLIVSFFDFPPEAFPIIATLGFLVDPAATMLNSSGDTIASMMVTRRIEGRDWIKKI